MADIAKPVRILLVACPPAVSKRIPVLLAAVDRGRYACESVAELEQGLQRLARNDVDLVLFGLSRAKDRSLPDFLQARTHIVSRPIIVLAHPDQEALAIEAVQRGAQDYLLTTSCLDAKQLTHALEGALDGYRLSGEAEQLTRQLQATEANFYQMIQNNADGMVIIDCQGTVCFVNPAAEMLLGRPAAELIGRPFDFPATSGTTDEVEIIQGGSKLRTTEMHIVETLWEGRPAHLASLRDVTERKRLEALKDEFVSKVSHELRTPMTSIKGAVTLMLERSLGEINAEQEDFLKTISQDIDRLAELINNVLDLSKMEVGKMTVNRQRLEPAALIEQVCRSYQTLLGKRTIAKRFDPVPLVYADRNLVIQVITNLLGNAIKFTKEDGTITFSLRVDGAFVAVGVSDNGPGMPKAALAKLFQKFVQADSAPTAGQPKGTGLGLAICREIVQLHQGRIWVESEVGQGSTFAFTLPAYEPAQTFSQLIQELKENAAAEQSEFSLLVVDVAALRGRPDQGPGAERLTGDLEEAVRKSVSRNDHVLLLEPSTLAILAVTDAVGAAAMQARLIQVCSAWCDVHLGQGTASGVGVGTATFPKDGETPDTLIRLACSRAAETRSPGPINGSGTEATTHGGGNG